MVFGAQSFHSSAIRARAPQPLRRIVGWEAHTEVAARTGHTGTVRAGTWPSVDARLGRGREGAAGTARSNAVGHAGANAETDVDADARADAGPNAGSDARTDACADRRADVGGVGEEREAK
jgi:hypothetical protein